MTRVLIAEASPVLGAAYQRSFSGCGCEVETAASAEECAAGVDGFAPDVLILDLHLPCDGANRVLTWLRRVWVRQVVPVVVLIGDASSQSVTEIILTCPLVAAYFQKPFRLSVLQEVVGSAAAATGRRAPRDHRRIRTILAGTAPVKR